MKNLEPKPRAGRPPVPFLAAFLALAFLANPLPARAGCLVEYADCVEAAAEADSFWKRSVLGLMCAADIISCIRSSLD